MSINRKEDVHRCHCGSYWFKEIRMFLHNTAEAPQNEEHPGRIQCTECNLKYERDIYNLCWTRVYSE